MCHVHTAVTTCTVPCFSISKRKYKSMALQRCCHMVMCRCTLYVTVCPCDAIIYRKQVLDKHRGSLLFPYIIEGVGCDLINLYLSLVNSLPFPSYLPTPTTDNHGQKNNCSQILIFGTSQQSILGANMNSITTAPPLQRTYVSYFAPTYTQGLDAKMLLFYLGDKILLFICRVQFSKMNPEALGKLTRQK